MKIEVKERKEIGTNKVKHIRREGWIPGIIYGHGEKSSHIKIREEDLIRLVHELHSAATLITLDLDGKELQAIIREAVRDPLTEKLIHVDFQHIHEDEEVTVHVAIDFEGEAKGIEEGGILDIERRHLTVRCLPKAMPGKIVIDVSDLGIGDSFHIGDLELSKEVEVMEDSSATIVNVLSPRKVVEVVPEEEELLIGEEEEEPEIIKEGETEAPLTKEEKEETKE